MSGIEKPSRWEIRLSLRLALKGRSRTDRNGRGNHGLATPSSTGWIGHAKDGHDGDHADGKKLLSSNMQTQPARSEVVFRELRNEDESVHRCDRQHRDDKQELQCEQAAV